MIIHRVIEKILTGWKNNIKVLFPPYKILN